MTDKTARTVLEEFMNVAPEFAEKALGKGVEITAPSMGDSPDRLMAVLASLPTNDEGMLVECEWEPDWKMTDGFMEKPTEEVAELIYQWMWQGAVKLALEVEDLLTARLIRYTVIEQGRRIPRKVKLTMKVEWSE